VKTVKMEWSSSLKFGCGLIPNECIYSIGINLLHPVQNVSKLYISRNIG